MRPHARTLLALSTVAAFGLAACDDDGSGLDRLGGTLDTELLIDFGDVQVGILAERSHVVTNNGEGLVNVKSIERGENFSAATHEFGIPSAPFALTPNAPKTLKATFQPLALTEAPVESSFTFVTDAEGDSKTVKVTVRGRGIASGLLIEPDPVEFGNVLPGSSKTLDVKITNLMSFAVDVLTRPGRTGTPELETIAGDGRFEIASPVEVGGSILPGDTLLGPGASITVQATYTPDAGSDGHTDRARWTVSSCPSSVCEVTVVLQGRGSSESIECAPEVLDFGAVNPGRVVMRPIVCTNVASDTVRIVGAEIEAGSSRDYVIGTFVPPDMLNPGESFTFPAGYGPTSATLGMGPQAGVAVVSAETLMSRALDPARVSLTARTGGPAINVQPAQLHFGWIAIGTRSTKALLVANDGYEDLIVNPVDPDQAMTGMFSVDTTAFSLPAGTSTVVRVTFEPGNPSMIGSAVTFSSNDASSPQVAIPVDGGGVDLPPCSYTAAPIPLAFGVITAGTRQTLALRIENTGIDDCLMNDLELLEAPGVPSMAFTLVNGNETGIVLQPGTFKDIPVEFAPTTSGNASAYVTFYVSNPADPNPTFPVTGIGEASTEITCPGPVTTPAGTPVNLTVNVTNRGTTVTSYQWTIVNAPPGGIGTPTQWTPAAPMAATEAFLPYIVGNYAIHVTVVDNTGASSSCDTVVTAEGHGLRVTMAWDGSGDVDLHVSNSLTDPWFGSTTDCYYANRTPIWDGAFGASLGPNPELDFDNTSSFGPENTSINAPVIGTVYTIGAHNYSSSAGRIVTITVFCGGVTVPNSTFISVPLTGNAGGQCTANDFWKVATVEFTSPTTCTITPINTMTASSDRCLTY